MRTITDHKLNGLNDALEITVLDEPGQGGACHEYEIISEGTIGTIEDGYDGSNRLRISFQNGPIEEDGVNGISVEALIAINIDRLKGFQSGQFATEDNQRALEHLQAALGFLQKRTRDRLARGVEGTNQK